MLAQLCAMIANSGGGKEGGGQFTADEMMPVQRPRLPSPPQDPQETRENLRACLAGV